MRRLVRYSDYGLDFHKRLSTADRFLPACAAYTRRRTLCGLPITRTRLITMRVACPEGPGLITARCKMRTGCVGRLTLGRRVGSRGGCKGSPTERETHAYTCMRKMRPSLHDNPDFFMARYRRSRHDVSRAKIVHFGIQSKHTVRIRRHLSSTLATPQQHLSHPRFASLPCIIGLRSDLWLME